MSSTLKYRPIKPEKDKTLSDAAKYVLKEKYQLTDGPFSLSEANLEYLQGLKDGGLKEIKGIINQIHTYGGVEIYLSY